MRYIKVLFVIFSGCLFKLPSNYTLSTNDPSKLNVSGFKEINPPPSVTGDTPKSFANSLNEQAATTIEPPKIDDVSQNPTHPPSDQVPVAQGSQVMAPESAERAANDLHLENNSAPSATNDSPPLPSLPLVNPPDEQTVSPKVDDLLHLDPTQPPSVEVPAAQHFEPVVKTSDSASEVLKNEDLEENPTANATINNSQQSAHPEQDLSIPPTASPTVENPHLDDMSSNEVPVAEVSANLDELGQVDEFASRPHEMYTSVNPHLGSENLTVNALKLSHLLIQL